MISPFDLETAKQRHEDLLRGARQRRMAAPLRKARRSKREELEESNGVAVSWELAEEEPSLATGHHRALRR
jgi:hypothetical protein